MDNTESGAILRNLLSKHTNSYVLPDSIAKTQISLTASFVIPVFNSAASIRHCVESIYRQTGRDLIREVILINDGSTDNSWQILQKLRNDYANILPIILIDNDRRRYASHTRNRGIEASTGDLVFFIDSDIVLPPTYLLAHARIQAANGSSISFSLRADILPSQLSSLTFPVPATNEFRAAIIKRYNFLNDTPYTLEKEFTIADLCLTCAITYRRADLLNVKGCPENFTGWGYNDTAMAAKVIALDRPVIPVSDATVYHIAHTPRSGSEATKQAERILNKSRYERMLDMKYHMTFDYYLAEIEGPNHASARL